METFEHGRCSSGKMLFFCSLLPVLKNWLFASRLLVFKNCFFANLPGFQNLVQLQFKKEASFQMSDEIRVCDILKKYEVV